MKEKRMDKGCWMIARLKEDAAGFRIDLMLKDLGLVTDAARSARQPLLLGALAREIYQKHSADGNGAKDFSSIILQYRP